MVYKQQFVLVLVLFLLIIGVGFRVKNITEDPSVSYLNAADEGTHSHAARNLYLYHQFRTDGLCFGCIMPVFPFVQYIGLALFGFGPFGFRFSSILLSIITPLFLFLFLRKKLGLQASLISALVLFTSYYYLVFARVGMPEITMLFFSFLAFISFYKAINNQSFVFSMLAGLLSALAFFSKQSATPLLLVFLFVSFKNYRILLGILLAWFLAGMLWYIFFLRPHWEVISWNFAATIGGNRPRRALLDPLYVFTQIRSFVIGQQWLYLPGFFLIPLLLVFNRIKSLLYTLVSFWLLSLFIYFILIPSQYGRFFIQALLPLSIGFGLLYKRFPFLILVLFIVSVSVTLCFSYLSFVKYPAFSYQNGARELYRYVGQKKVVAPLGWTIYERFNNYGIYGVPESYFKNKIPTQVVYLNSQIPKKMEFKKKVEIGDYTLFIQH